MVAWGWLSLLRRPTMMPIQTWLPSYSLAVPRASRPHHIVLCSGLVTLLAVCALEWPHPPMGPNDPALLRECAVKSLLEAANWESAIKHSMELRQLWTKTSG